MSTFKNKLKRTLTILEKKQRKQDKYTRDPVYSNLLQQSENNFQQKVIFENKK